MRSLIAPVFCVAALLFVNSGALGQATQPPLLLHLRPLHRRHQTRPRHGTKSYRTKSGGSTIRARPASVLTIDLPA